MWARALRALRETCETWVHARAPEETLAITGAAPLSLERNLRRWARQRRASPIIIGGPAARRRKRLRDATTTWHSMGNVARGLLVLTRRTHCAPRPHHLAYGADSGGTNQGAFTMRPEPTYLAVVALRCCCRHFYLGYRRGNAALYNYPAPCRRGHLPRQQGRAFRAPSLSLTFNLRTAC